MTIEASEKQEVAKPYWLYLLECRGGTFYAGIARDASKRFEQHCRGKGAAYTRSRPPIRVLASRSYESRSEALKAEYQVKQLPKARKMNFFG